MYEKQSSTLDIVKYLIFSYKILAYTVFIYVCIYKFSHVDFANCNVAKSIYYVTVLQKTLQGHLSIESCHMQTGIILCPSSLYVSLYFFHLLNYLTLGVIQLAGVEIMGTLVLSQIFEDIHSDFLFYYTIGLHLLYITFSMLIRVSFIPLQGFCHKRMLAYCIKCLCRIHQILCFPLLFHEQLEKYQSPSP